MGFGSTGKRFQELTYLHCSHVVPPLTVMLATDSAAAVPDVSSIVASVHRSTVSSGRSTAHHVLVSDSYFFLLISVAVCSSLCLFSYIVYDLPMIDPLGKHLCWYFIIAHNIHGIHPWHIRYMLFLFNMGKTIHHGPHCIHNCINKRVSYGYWPYWSTVQPHNSLPLRSLLDG